MKLPVSLACLACALFAGGAPAFAAEQPAPEKPAATVAAPVPEKVFLATELEALRPQLGQKVTVEGKLERAGQSKSQTVRYLNFTADFRDSVALVFFTSKGGDTFSKEKVAEWLGRKVRATGTLSEFDSRLQIEIENWEQLQKLSETAPAQAP